MSFLYPRKIDVRRPNSHAALPRVPAVVTALDYGGVQRTDETTVLRGLPASVQSKGSAGERNNSLPSDTGATGIWEILIPRNSAKCGQIKARDIIVDDLGERYQVTFPYWNSLGYKLRCKLLEV